MASPLDAQLEVLCEALLGRLLPALQPIVEQAAAKAAVQALQGFTGGAGAGAGAGGAQGATLLGPLPPRKKVTVEWTFTNTSEETWAGCHLRFLGGTLAPASGSAGGSSLTPVVPEGRVTLQAQMRAPAEPGPCEARWQLETPDGQPLSPPMPVLGHVERPERERPARLEAQLPQQPQSLNCGPTPSMASSMPPSMAPTPSLAPVASVHTASAVMTQPVGQANLRRVTERQLWQQVFERFFGQEALFV
ncbi:unnamed protein product [Effrenium voratum]|nr:unnamed protein product [Effrenium voratum]